MGWKEASCWGKEVIRCWLWNCWELERYRTRSALNINSQFECVCANLEKAEVHFNTQKLVFNHRPTERSRMHCLMKETHVNVYDSFPCAGPNAHMFILTHIHSASKIHLSCICVVVSDSCNLQRLFLVVPGHEPVWSGAGTITSWFMSQQLQCPPFHPKIWLVAEVLVHHHTMHSRFFGQLYNLLWWTIIEISLEQMSSQPCAIRRAHKIDMAFPGIAWKWKIGSK